MELLGIINGWSVTPDTVISVWLAIKLTGAVSYLKELIHQHDKRITILENQSNGN